MQAKNQNKIKNAKMFRRPMSGYNVGEPFESDKWILSIIVVGHMGYLTCEIFFPTVQ